MLIVGCAIWKRPLWRNVVLNVAFIRIAVKIALEGLGLVEPPSSIHTGLTFHAGHRHVLRLRSQNDSVIMLCVLKIILSCHCIAGRHRVPCQRAVFFRDVHGCTADLHVGTA